MNFTGKRECGQSRLCITYVCTGANNGKNKSNLYINGKKCFEKLLSLAEGMQTKLCILPKIKTFRCCRFVNDVLQKSENFAEG